MMGGAYRAKHALFKDKLSFDDILNSLPEPELVCKPYDDADSVSLKFIYVPHTLWASFIRNK